ncbi:RNA polymerase sigma factor [Nocardia brevicatena]|uniref:RNA polymerase sigma factor n=1 Tax=Nocardia brevicatena TaxID=37327 RepID=UPI00030FA193|nr:DUF6596 domain-containing protein [Nocardia brevicatena]
MTGTRTIEDLLRDLTPQVLGPLIRKFGDFTAAEDALQEAMLAAVTRWPADGVPDNPQAWLLQVAQRRITDTIRADIARRNREAIAAARDTRPAPTTPESVVVDAPLPLDLGPSTTARHEGQAEPPTPTPVGRSGNLRADTGKSRSHDARPAAATDPTTGDLSPPPARPSRTAPPHATDPEPDDTLTLLFLCCHPTLPPAGAIALTLRAVAGLTTTEIARAFLLPEATMAQRITRAKRLLAKQARPFAPPGPGEWRQRLVAVLRVLYLIFTEGHTSTSGPRLQRTDLSTEAIRLTRRVHRLLPEDPEVGGLLALMLLTDARRAARTGPAGELIPLSDQDRHRWDRATITEGLRLITATMRHGLTGPYQIQAAIAALHAQAAHHENTDWASILRLYHLLERVAPGPLVTLNRAVATAMVHGPEAALTLIADLDEPLSGTHRLAAVRAHLYEMSGDIPAAIAQYAAAAHRTGSVAERDYLTLRAARLRHTR